MQQSGQEAVNRTFHLDESCSFPTSVTTQGFPDEGQTDPLVRLLSCHCPLSKKDQMTSDACAVVEKLHQIDTVPCDSETNCLRASQLRRCRLFCITVYDLQTVQIQLAKRLQILNPLINQV